MSKEAFEVNFDGLVGPTHNFAGLSHGNLASQRNAHRVSHPKAAAIQGLKKMYQLYKLGIPQAILPPHQRPAISTLKRLGFSGTDHEIVEKAFHQDPNIAIACFSASSMWAANAATIAPTPDTLDGKLHLTAANLISTFHRSIEAEETTDCLKTLFSDPSQFVVHNPLPQHPIFADEGAANHTRLCKTHGGKGIHLFTYGRSTRIREETSPHMYPARQSYEASQAIARLHGLSEEQTVFAKQNPEAIDLGVFHNDVIAVGHTNILFYHELAWINTQAVIDEIQEKMDKVSNSTLYPIQVSCNDLSIERSVRTYLFNSQLVTLPDQSCALIAPEECLEDPITRDLLHSYLDDSNNPISKLTFIPLNESMKNGGGPACVRLRIVLTDKQLKSIHQGVLLNDSKFEQIKKWIENHFREILTVEDLTDPMLIKESYQALDALTKILNLKNFYPFQNS